MHFAKHFLIQIIRFRCLFQFSLQTHHHHPHYYKYSIFNCYNQEQICLINFLNFQNCQKFRQQRILPSSSSPLITINPQFPELPKINIFFYITLLLHSIPNCSSKSKFRRIKIYNNSPLQPETAYGFLSSTHQFDISPSLPISQLQISAFPSSRPISRSESSMPTPCYD